MYGLVVVNVVCVGYTLFKNKKISVHLIHKFCDKNCRLKNTYLESEMFALDSSHR